MRDQYAGDVSDLLKLAFLRALADDDRTIGVGWYYNPEHDGRYQDGRHREYCDEPKWEALDLALVTALRELRKQPERSVKALEELPIWPRRTVFHRKRVPFAGNRQFWAADMKSKLREANIIFLDPDNGLGRATKRHTTVAEVAAMRQPGRAIVVIKFPGRGGNHARQIEAYHNLLRDQTGAISLATARTCASVAVVNKRGLRQRVPRIRWFTIVDADKVLTKRAKQFAHELNGIDKCCADVVCEPFPMETRECQTTTDNTSESVQLAPESPPTDRTKTGENLCPECDYKFKGNGFDGIDAHWRGKHEDDIMPYKEAWPLIKSGTYPRKGLQQNRERREGGSQNNGIDSNRAPRTPALRPRK
jgi:hypothetical protein